MTNGILRLIRFSAESENLILRIHTDKGTSFRLIVFASFTNTRYVISYRSCRLWLSNSHSFKFQLGLFLGSINSIFSKCMNNCALHNVYVTCYFGDDVMDSLISYSLRLGHF